MTIKRPFTKYQCPKCGRWSDNISLVKRTEPEYNHAKACAFGGETMDWVEYHECPECKTKFSFDNSNC